MIIRVFPTQTSQTPLDDYAFFAPPGLWVPEHKEVHVSCAFTWDKHAAEQLAEAWYGKVPVKLGGPAYDDPGETFTPGMYTKKGITFTSRGCPNNCKFCHVPRREGKIKEIPVTAGNIIQDNNFLACSQSHREKVYQMLRQQSKVEMRGGLEVARLTDWDIEQMRSVRMTSLWIACDTKGAQNKAIKAIRRLRAAGFSQKHIRCYVLIGDDRTENEARLRAIYDAGALPFAQLYQPEERIAYSKEWKDFARVWSRPAIYKSVMSAGKEADAMRYLAHELYKGGRTGHTRKLLMERVADGYGLYKRAFEEVCRQFNYGDEKDYEDMRDEFLRMVGKPEDEGRLETMRELPILFSTPMVTALLNTKPNVWPADPIDASKPCKTQTRRIIKSQPETQPVLRTNVTNKGRPTWVSKTQCGSLFQLSPYQPGDRLYVKETWKCIKYNNMDGDLSYGVEFKDGSRKYFDFDDHERFHQFGKFALKEGWQSSLFMPKEAARIWLEVMSVRAEQLSSITEEDAIREGFWGVECAHVNADEHGCTDCINAGWLEPPTVGFMHTWDILNAKRGFPFESSPYVWVYELKRVEVER